MMTPSATQIPLHDIHLPDAAHWWPPAPGWWLLSVVAITVMVFIAFYSYRQLKFLRWRNALLNEFTDFIKSSEQRSAAEKVIHVAENLRRLSLTLYPANNTASLTGQAWLQFLNDHAPQAVFTSKPFTLLIEAPYKPIEQHISDNDVKQITQQARQWARFNCNRNNYQRLKKYQQGKRNELA